MAELKNQTYVRKYACYLSEGKCGRNIVQLKFLEYFPLYLFYLGITIT
jgi:hypothetical protein